jgi:putative ABC transport system substrate-binding protein
MRRREFISLLGGAAATWPLTAGAQQSERVRRIGMLYSLAENDSESVVRRAAFEQALKKLGWTNGMRPGALGLANSLSFRPRRRRIV